jgi:hypothetical protein
MIRESVRRGELIGADHINPISSQPITVVHSHEQEKVTALDIGAVLWQARLSLPLMAVDDDSYTIEQNGTHHQTLLAPPTPLEFSRLVHISRPVVIKGVLSYKDD